MKLLSKCSLVEMWVEWNVIWVKRRIGWNMNWVKRYIGWKFIGWNVLGETWLGETWLGELLPHHQDEGSSRDPQSQGNLRYKDNQEIWGMRSNNTVSMNEERIGESGTCPGVEIWDKMIDTLGGIRSQGGREHRLHHHILRRQIITHLRGRHPGG